MKTILIGTTNPGKFKEMKAILSDLTLETLSPKDFSNLIPPEETGKTLDENAELKARYYTSKTGLPSVCDDAGLEIDALDGEPGVKTRRWIHGDRDSTDQELINYTLERLRGVPYEKRTARLRTVIAFFDGKDIATKSGSIEGYVMEQAPPEVEPGYPFRSLLFIPKFGKLYKDLTPEEHEQINHRLKALNDLKPIIRNKLVV